MDRWQAHADAVNAVVYAPDARTLVTAGRADVAVWDRPLTSPVRRFPTAGSGPPRPAVSADGTALAFATGDFVQVWRLPAPALTRAWPIPGLNVAAFQFSPDGRHLVGAGLGGPDLAWVWDVAGDR